MPRKPTGNPNGRPPISIDETQFKKLCGMQCTEEEIAGFFNCSIDTLNNWCKRMFGMTFSDTYKIHSATGRISLRRVQWKLAEKSPAMAIFLGKNILGQSDKIEQTVTEVEDLSPLVSLLSFDVAPKATSSNEENTSD